MPHDEEQSVLPVGKLRPDLLAALLRDALPRRPDPSVVLGPGLGIDAAAVRVGDRYVLAASDPITFATSEAGWYAVHVNANDIAVCGAEPRWFLATILLPEHATAAAPRQLMAQISAACAEVGATLIGGHTEVTSEVRQPIVVGTMLGEVAPDGLRSSSGARPGDAVLLAGGIAVEGTALLARELAATVDAQLGPEVGARCRAFLHQPGISVVAAARHAVAHGAHALHDPTEGGLATALHELATAAGCGLEIDADAIPIFPETQALCRLFGLDPLGLIASGALLVTLDPAAAAALHADLARAHISAAVIGRVLPSAAGCTLRRGDQVGELPSFERDEIARLFSAPPGGDASRA